jgi:hypothetical protein
VVIYSTTLEDHLMHLDMIFQLFDNLNIALKPSKSYIGYPSATLLRQKVNGFGLSTSEERITAISALEFPKALKALETYLGLN